MPEDPKRIASELSGPLQKTIKIQPQGNFGEPTLKGGKPTKPNFLHRILKHKKTWLIAGQELKSGTARRKRG